MVVRIRKGAKPGRVLARGETTPAIELIREGLPPRGSLERVIELEKRIAQHVPVPGDWDQTAYDLRAEYETAAAAHYGPKWYKHASHLPPERVAP